MLQDVTQEAEAEGKAGQSLAPVASLSWPADAAAQSRALAVLEQGGVAVLPDHPFELQPDERRFLAPDIAAPKAKNISYDPSSGRMGGALLEGADAEALRAMLARFAKWSTDTVEALLPRYKGALDIRKTSFRPREVESRRQGARQDDRRLHADAFPSQPVQGRRILRVFANVNPEGRARAWRIGEPFEAYARRLIPHAAAYSPAQARLLQALKLTKSRRTGYDHLMLQLHDLAKTREDYRRDAPWRPVELPAGASWLVFTDAAVHAVTAGQHALEQTFMLPADAMAEPDRSPLRKSWNG